MKYSAVLSFFKRPENKPGRDLCRVFSPLEFPKAILFDIYDTLVASTIGDLNAQLEKKRGTKSFVKTAKHYGFEEKLGQQWQKLFFRYIEEEHERCRKLGILRAEVLVDVIWRRILDETLPADRSIEIDEKEIGLFREMCANPVALFDGVDDLFLFLKERNILIGIVSNAQYYTEVVLQWLLGRSLFDFVDRNLAIFSYKLGFAKPDPHFFRYAEVAVRLMGLAPKNVWVVGNDPINDMASSRPYGFATVLFAGKGSIEEVAGSDIDAIVGSFGNLLDLVKGLE
ncbi:MAG: HAD family hydrolase [Deltaproteobacteria bacterium]|nr:HAD family hydrolase [Deltaproteobacteria bacterium]MBW2069363.1 HAD family hydrolase [Deltaproteobacteria bacterium]